MGYCYSWDGKLSCDACGAANGHTRKRICPVKVHYYDGTRPLPNCCAIALCPSCYAKHKATLHKDCPEQAARSQARIDAEHARLMQGDAILRTRWGDWDDDTPKGYVRARYVFQDGREEMVWYPAALGQHAWPFGEWLSDIPF